MDGQIKGEFKDEYADGYGIIYFKDRIIYNGQFKRNPEGFNLEKTKSIIIKDKSKMDINGVMVYYVINKKNLCIKENLKDFKMGMELYIILMEIYMKKNLKMIIIMDLGYFINLMVKNLLIFGKMMN